MANYQPPNEMDAIFDSLKFVSLPEALNTNSIIIEELTAAQNKIIACDTLIGDITGVAFVPSSFFSNTNNITSNIFQSFSFTLSPFATYLVDFQFGLQVNGFNATNNPLYGINGFANQSQINIGLTPGVLSGVNINGTFTANYPVMPRTTNGANAFMENLHITSFVTTPGNGIVYVNIYVNTVDNNGNTVAGAYAINGPSTNNGVLGSPYTNQRTGGCKFIRIN
jgi:hypothetical protein